MTQGRGTTRTRRDERIWQAGFLVGSALGVAATIAARRMERSARQGLVDWPAAERVAIGRLRHAPGTLSKAELAATEADYAETMARIVPRLSAALGTELPGVVGRSGVVDRAGWVRANSTSFAALIRRLEGTLLDQILPPGGGIGQASVALANRWITTRQIGFMLGFMGTRVLGQYDLALLSAETTPGRLLFVEENIRQTAAILGRAARRVPDLDRPPRDDPRVRVRGAPLAPAVPRRPARAPARRLLERHEAACPARCSGGSAGRSRGEADGEHWMERLMSDEQRRLFRETQAVMSLLEGFSDYIMDEVGRDLVPDVERISERFHARREQRKSGFERAVMRLTGMDMKIEQYKKGERFVAAIAARGGKPALERLWAGPEIAAPRGRDRARRNAGWHG